MKHLKSLGSLLVGSLAVLLSACGGIPSDYVDAFGIDAGQFGATSCGRPSEPGLFVIFGGYVPGDEPIEFRSVEALDASFEPVEVYVVHTPADKTIGFGWTRLASVGQGSPVLEAAWQNRSAPPASAPPNTHGELVVVVPAPADVNGVNYVHDFRIAVAVGDETRTFDWTSLHMLGNEQACAELEHRLLG